jgi:hypothetical protein
LIAEAQEESEEMMLSDGLCYTLPDGTVVRAVLLESRPHFPAHWRLDTIDGQPIYLQDRGCSWVRLTYDPKTGGYRATPCDLTDADIEPVF